MVGGCPGIGSRVACRQLSFVAVAHWEQLAEVGDDLIEPLRQCADALRFGDWISWHVHSLARGSSARPLPPSQRQIRLPSHGQMGIGLLSPPARLSPRRSVRATSRAVRSVHMQRYSWRPHSTPAPAPPPISQCLFFSEQPPSVRSQVSLRALFTDISSGYSVTHIQERL